LTNKISTTTWFDFSAVCLESDRLRLVCVPELGAKIVSILDKTHGHEWLVPPMRPLQKTSYGAVFTDQDMSGWDEMMPTITACRWQDTDLPDHGELWSIPWRLEESGAGIGLSVDSPVLPYRLTRRILFAAPNRLEFIYHLKHTRDEIVMPYLWAAHPQFAADAQTRIILPPEVNRVVNVIEPDSRWGQAGKEYSWPLAVDIQGKELDLSRVGSADLHSCRKFYLPVSQPVGWAGLVQEDKGCELRLSWSTVELPYLGLWVDEGLVNSQPVAAPEPSNAYYDSLERAVNTHRVTWLQPHEERSWTLSLTVNDWRKKG